jgi:hypothetical protein
VNTTIPVDFPANSYSSSLAGAQPKIAMVEVDGKYYAEGNTPDQQLERYPNMLSTAKKWANDPVTAAFGSELNPNLLMQAKLWIHGHTHHSCDYEVKKVDRSVRVVCNPRGYPQSRLQNMFENSSLNSGLLVGINN